MKVMFDCLALRHTGPGEALVGRCPMSPPGPGEVRVKVEAIALNPHRLQSVGQRSSFETKDPWV